MRLLLVDNLLFENDGGNRRYELDPHLGLISLAAVARQNGHDVDIYDPKRDLNSGSLRLDGSLYGEMANRIRALAPDVVGFTALGCNLHCVARTATALRQQDRELPILLGGPQATILDREVLTRFAAFDIVVRSEAEETLPALLEKLHRGRLDHVQGITYRASSGEICRTGGNPIIDDLDRLPFPAYGCYPIDELGLPRISVEAGRGCPFSCTFCSTASFFGRRYRLKSAERLVAEMDRLNTEYGFVDFALNHDLFTVNRKKILTFCEAVRERGFRWSCSARVDCVDPELLRAMAAAGCDSIYFGIETGSVRMQAISQKRLDLTLVEPAIDLCDGLGIKTTASFITGYPEETAVDQGDTLDLAGRLFVRPGGRTHAQLHLLTPEPGTALSAQYGETLRFDGHGTDHNFPVLDGEDAALLEADPILFSGHHFFPTVVPRHRNVFVTTALTALTALGPDVLRCLMDAFGGRLGPLLDAIDDWRQRNREQPAVMDSECVARFVSATCGVRHPLTSLCRYAVAMRAARLAAERGDLVPPAAPKKDTTLVLAPNVAVLPDLHHPKALAAMSDGRDPPDNPLVDVLVKPEPAARRAVTFTIDPSTIELLSRFEEPRSYRELCRNYAAERGKSPPWTVLLGFVEAGVLVAAQ